MHSPNADSSGLPYTPYTLTGGVPLYLDQLAADVDADLAIVGAGVTGLSCAIHGQLAGLKTVVVEAKEVGWGASSRNSGHIPAATRQEPAAIMQSFGPVYGPRIIHASREAPELVYGLAQRYGMSVTPVRAGGIQVAHNRASAEKLRQRVEDLERLGYALQWLDARRTADMVGSAPGLYKAGVLDPAGGTLNPLAYTRGLARAALSEGARVFERTPVQALEPVADGWRLRCATGTVRARAVAVCTNGYSAGLLPELWRSIIAVRAYQFVTTPLPDAVRQTILPGRQGFTDTRRMMSGIRIHEDGRLHFSGLGAFFGAEVEPDIELSVARMRQLFPQVGDLELDYWWSGWMAMNRDSTWKLHELAPGLLAALGCNGRGVGLGTLCGRELARYVSGVPAGELVLPFSPAKRIPLHGLRQPMVGTLAHGYRLLDAIETTRTPLSEVSARRADPEEA